MIIEDLIYLKDLYASGTICQYAYVNGKFTTFYRDYALFQEQNFTEDQKREKFTELVRKRFFTAPVTSNSLNNRVTVLQAPNSQTFEIIIDALINNRPLVAAGILETYIKVPIEWKMEQIARDIVYLYQEGGFFPETVVPTIFQEVADKKFTQLIYTVAEQVHKIPCIIAKDFFIEAVGILPPKSRGEQNISELASLFQFVEANLPISLLTARDITDALHAVDKLRKVQMIKQMIFFLEMMRNHDHDLVVLYSFFLIDPKNWKEFIFYSLTLPVDTIPLEVVKAYFESNPVRLISSKKYLANRLENISPPWTAARIAKMICENKELFQITRYDEQSLLPIAEKRLNYFFSEKHFAALYPELQ